jgi:isochorismate synthase
VTLDATARAPVDQVIPCTPGDAAAFVVDALARTNGAVAHITVPAPVAAPEALLSITGDDASSVLWCPPGDVGFAGAGEAVRFDVAGAREGAARLWRRVVDVSFPGCAGPAPRLFGGLAFAPGAASEPPWSAFGDGRFVLPRWRYAVDGDRAWLTLAGTRNPVAMASDVADILHALARAPRRPVAAPAVRAIEQQSPASWRGQIDAIRTEIAAGRCDKIVAARRCVVELDARADDAGVLARLAERYPACFRYAFRSGDATFVGATPERLIAKRGDAIETQALAGSIDAGSLPDAGDALRASDKDSHEHGFVVRAILDALAPFCRELTSTDAPEICTLRHLLHLRTPITGRMRGPAHVLDLVDALHPTPAVGGVPTASALDWIAAHEPAPRGWYAGPVGWFDAAGDGEFAVALRSGLLVGNRAYVYAGAGIVAESDADAEYAETDLKQRALLGALGVAG